MLFTHKLIHLKILSLSNYCLVFVSQNAHNVHYAFVYKPTKLKRFIKSILTAIDIKLLS